MKTLAVILIPFLFLFSCSKDKQPETNSYAYFEKYLKPEMNYSSFTAIFGEPSKDVGSGIHIYVYVLNDSTEIWIGYVNKIIYARHVTRDRQVLDDMFKL